jgi:UDP-glucose 4-epimerase
MIKSQKIFITGGAGYLGKHLIKKWYNDNEITVFSRDEAKHYFLKKLYPEVNFIVGDVRNRDLLTKSSQGHTMGVFAASLKQIEACEKNYEEATQIIVQGAFNSKHAAIVNNFISACYISSDKAISPTTIYGMCKGLAGESFISNNNNISPSFTTAIYGNILNSTGSIIPVIWEHIRNKTEFVLYGDEMTRFILTVDEAIDIIEKSVNFSNTNILTIAKSFKIKDMVDIFHEEFGLQYKITKPRENEKIHELLASNEHLPRLTFNPIHNCLLMNKEISSNPFKLDFSEYSSKDHCLKKEELFESLEQFGFYER